MKTILIVDDEPVVRRVLTLALEQARYRVVSASNGEEALDLVRDCHPDVLITDIEIRNTTGHLVSYPLNNFTNTLPVFTAGGVTPPRVGPATARRRALPAAKTAHPIRKLIEGTGHSL